jgi:hypothetical protein
VGFNGNFVKYSNLNQRFVEPLGSTNFEIYFDPMNTEGDITF